MAPVGLDFQNSTSTWNPSGSSSSHVSPAGLLIPLVPVVVISISTWPRVDQRYSILEFCWDTWEVMMSELESGRQHVEPEIVSVSF